MLNLDKHIRLTDDTATATNLTDKFDDKDLVRIGEWTHEGYVRDCASRAGWVKRMQAAMDLALQLQKEKTFPWPGASNVAFPLITIATLQFHSRAYPAILSGPEPVQYRVTADDPTGQETQRAIRIGQHMSWQIMEEDEDWEEQFDRLLINVPIVGSAFKKTYFSAIKGHNESEFVPAKDLVMDYFAKSVEECARKTHVIPMHKNELYEKIQAGIFRDVSEENWFNETARETVRDYREDLRKGTTPPQGDETTPYTILEQHCLIDLDGDGYAEPYIVTIEDFSKSVLRIVARWESSDDIRRLRNGKIVNIKTTEYFTKYGFIPSPDGGVYDLGFGILLGPLNESVNTLINQLIDAGTMATTAGGFLGRGVKIRGGSYTFAPLEWKRVDSTGDDLQKGIFPLPVREPSSVLFQLLGLLIDYTNRVSGATDTMAGINPGQNTPAETSRTMVEQGMKIYSAIFKRIWRSMKWEFKKLYGLNAAFLPEKKFFGTSRRFVLREDYRGDPANIAPVADPNITSEATRLAQAVTLKQAAYTTPGYNLQEVEKNFLRAHRVPNIDQIYPGPDKVPPLPNPKMQAEQVKAQVKMQQIQSDQQKFIVELMEERRVNSAKILEIQARAEKEMAEAKGVETGHQLAAIDAVIGILKHHDETLNKRIDAMLKHMEITNAANDSGAGVSGMGTPPSNSGIQGSPQPMG